MISEKTIENLLLWFDKIVGYSDRHNKDGSFSVNFNTYDQERVIKTLVKHAPDYLSMYLLHFFEYYLNGIEVKLLDILKKDENLQATIDFYTEFWSEINTVELQEYRSDYWSKYFEFEELLGLDSSEKEIEYLNEIVPYSMYLYDNLERKVLSKGALSQEIINVPDRITIFPSLGSIYELAYTMPNGIFPVMLANSNRPEEMCYAYIVKNGELIYVLQDRLDAEYPGYYDYGRNGGRASRRHAEYWKYDYPYDHVVNEMDFNHKGYVKSHCFNDLKYILFSKLDFQTRALIYGQLNIIYRNYKLQPLGIEDDDLTLAYSTYHKVAVDRKLLSTSKESTNEIALLTENKMLIKHVEKSEFITQEKALFGGHPYEKDFPPISEEFKQDFYEGFESSYIESLENSNVTDYLLGHEEDSSLSNIPRDLFMGNLFGTVDKLNYYRLYSYRKEFAEHIKKVTAEAKEYHKSYPSDREALLIRILKKYKEFFEGNALSICNKEEFALEKGFHFDFDYYNQITSECALTGKMTRVGIILKIYSSKLLADFLNLAEEELLYKHKYMNKSFGGLDGNSNLRLTDPLSDLRWIIDNRANEYKIELCFNKTAILKLCKQLDIKFSKFWIGYDRNDESRHTIIKKEEIND